MEIALNDKPLSIMLPETPLMRGFLLREGLFLAGRCLPGTLLTRGILSSGMATDSRWSHFTNLAPKGFLLARLSELRSFFI